MSHTLWVIIWTSYITGILLLALYIYVEENAISQDILLYQIQFMLNCCCWHISSHSNRVSIFRRKDDFNVIFLMTDDFLFLIFFFENYKISRWFVTSYFCFFFNFSSSACLESACAYDSFRWRSSEHISQNPKSPLV